MAGTDLDWLWGINAGLCDKRVQKREETNMCERAKMASKHPNSPANSSDVSSAKKAKRMQRWREVYATSYPLLNPSILTMSYLWWCYWVDRCNFAKGGSIFSKCKIRIWPMKLSWKKVPEILWMSLKNFCNVPEGLAEGLAALHMELAL